MKLPLDLADPHSLRGFGHEVVFQSMNQALENQPPIRATQDRLASALRMRHEPGDIASFVANSRDIIERAVWVGLFSGFAVGINITPEDLVVCPQPGQRLFIGKIAPFTVSDGHAQQFIRGNLICKRRTCRGCFQENVFAAELKRAIANQRTGEQPRLTQDLETIANSQHGPAIGRERLHCFHHWTESGDGSSAQIIAITKPARDDDGIGIAQRTFLMP